MSRMATVRTPKKKNTMLRRKKPPKLLEERPMCITMDHSTSDNSEQEGGKDFSAMKMTYHRNTESATHEHEQD